MKYALVNPRWTFEGSVYSGCKEPHLPLEFGYTKTLLEERGHDVLLLNAHLSDKSENQVARDIKSFKADIVVITTANTYLLWRSAQPDLRIPILLMEELREIANFVVAVGPHASTTPRATLQKLEVNAVVLGECEEVLPLFADSMNHLQFIPSIAYKMEKEVRIQGTPRSSNMTLLPSLRWDDETIRNHRHHHHRFEAEPSRPGAEMEVSRGCPYHCSSCTKDRHASPYRKRPQEKVLQELDALLKQGVDYIYFIDEIFLPDQRLLESFKQRNFSFGVQTRMELWTPELLELLGKAGCVSLEASVQRVTENPNLLQKQCGPATLELTERLIFARQNIPFVQANLLESSQDAWEPVEEWGRNLKAHGVCTKLPMPSFPYPGSAEYINHWGMPDDYAWERARNYYLKSFDNFNDSQERSPTHLNELEIVPG